MCSPASQSRNGFARKLPKHLPPKPGADRVAPPSSVYALSGPRGESLFFGKRLNFGSRSLGPPTLVGRPRRITLLPLLAGDPITQLARGLGLVPFPGSNLNKIL